MPVQMIGDILAAELSHMQAYIRFCSCQLNGASLLQQKTDEEADFKDYLKVSCSAAFDLRISSLTACLTSTDQIRITQRSKSCKNKARVFQGVEVYMHFQQVLYSASHSVSHYFGVVVNLRKLQRQCLHLPKIHVVKRGWSLWSLNKKAVGLNMLCNVQTNGA